MTVTFGGVAVRMLALGGNIALARLLSPRDFGMAAIGFTILTFGSFLANGGFGAALMGQSERPSREDLGAVLGIQMAVTLVFAAVVAAVGLSLGTIGALASLMTLTLPLDVLRVPSAILAERELVYRPIVSAQIVEIVTYYAWAISAAALGMGVWAIATGALVRAFAGSAALLALVPEGIVRPTLRFARVRRLLGFGTRFQAVGAVNLARDQGLNVAVASIAGVTALGLWTIAFRLVQSIMLLFEALWRVSYPAMARLLDAGEDARPLMARGVGVTATAAGFLAVAVGGTAPALVPTLFGDQWTDAASILPWAAVGVALAGPLSACAAGYLYAIGDAGTALRAAAIHTVVWFATSLPLLSPLGVEALGIGWLGACLTDCLVFARAVAQRTGLRLLRLVAAPSVATAIGVAGGLLVADGMPADALAVAASLAAGQILYGALIVTLYRRPLVDFIGLVGRMILPARASARLGWQ
jgi:O-antigen/teichoic acid export membrane protein